MSILALTGWQQPVDSLKNIAPDALHFDYSIYTDAEEMFSLLPKAPEIAVGWSLGGQLLVRAVAGGYIKPGKLVILSTAFQFVKSEESELGIAPEDFLQIKHNYIADKEKFLHSFHPLLALGSPNPLAVTKALDNTPILWKNGNFWLEELENTRLNTCDFSAFPETVLFHGKNDKVAEVKNAVQLKNHIPGSHLILLDTGHAPHLTHESIIKACLT